MKKTHFTNSSALAIIFFGILTIVGISVGKAQNDTINPLFSTTGPNVMGHGHMQWNSAVDYYHFNIKNIQGFDANLHCVGLSTGLRIGIGSRAEITFDINGRYNTWDTVYLRNTTGVNPSIGAKLQLLDGKGWLPQTSFYTYVGYTLSQNAFVDRWDHLIQPEIGFQFRNCIGRRWAIDYILGYSWDRYSVNAYKYNSGLLFSLFGRWLATDRLMLSAGGSNINSAGRLAGSFEAHWQVRHNLQLVGLVGMSGSKGDLGSDVQFNTLARINWMIR